MEDLDTNHPRPSLNSSEERLLGQLRANPLMAEKFQLVMDRLEEEFNNGADANEVEEAAIETLRDLGKAMLTQWAGNDHDRAIVEAKEKNPNLVGHGKKNSSGNRPSEPSG